MCCSARLSKRTFTGVEGNAGNENSYFGLYMGSGAFHDKMGCVLATALFSLWVSLYPYLIHLSGGRTEAWPGGGHFFSFCYFYWCCSTLLGLSSLCLNVQALSTLSRVSEGDLRRAITYLQCAVRLYGSSISSKEIISVSGVLLSPPVFIFFTILCIIESCSLDSARIWVSRWFLSGIGLSCRLCLTVS